MKPILLTIKGLHSFREEQTIDFAGLSGAGVFGIFGPTGSGKSSILDAMTLALYGKVERAANNTHGILNHAEDQLAVSFTFALQSGHRVSYKVERVFKRTDETKVKTALCRLIEIKDEQTVLADKANEVNKKVEELLGRPRSSSTFLFTSFALSASTVCSSLISIRRQRAVFTFVSSVLLKTRSTL